MLKRGYIDDKVAEYIAMFQMSREFGWTPEQIRNLSAEDYQAYLTMINAIAEAEEEKNRRLKNQLNKIR